MCSGSGWHGVSPGSGAYPLLTALSITMRGHMMSHYDNPAVEAAWQRCVRDAEEGVVREPVGIFRKEAELHVLAKRQGLTNEEAHEKLVEYMTAQGLSWPDKRAFPRNATIDLIREAFAQ